MQQEDVINILIETLAQKKSLSLEDLRDEIPCEKYILINVLAVLVKFEILERRLVDSDAFYTLKKELDPYQIVKAIEFGVSFDTLSKSLHLTEKQKKAAMTLSSNAQKIKQLDEQKRRQQQEEFLKKEKKPRNMVVEALEQIARASEESIVSYKSEISKEDDPIVLALKEAKAQALKALENYQNELAKGRGASVDFEDF